MGFNPQAFATAFLEGQAKDIKERQREGKDYFKRLFETAERNLPLHKKIEAQKKTFIQLANNLKELGMDEDKIMFYAKDGPKTLQAMHDLVQKKNAKWRTISDEDLSKEAVNAMADMPQEFAVVTDQYDSLADFINAGYDLSEKNDDAERPETEEIMRGNFLMGLMGYGAIERAKARAETEKFIGDKTIMDLNRLAAMQDFADPMGGAFEPAVVNIGAGPRIIEDSTRSAILKAQDTLYDRFTIGTEANTRMEQFLMDKGYNEDARKNLTVPLVSAVKDPTSAGGQEELLSLSQEFKEKMRFEAFEKATEAYNYGRDEIQQISPTYLTLYDKYGADRKTADYINRDALVTALKSGLGPGKYTIMEGGELKEVTVTQDEINMLIG